METKFNFKSQICTDKIQSEHLLALGLKKETADMKYPCTREYYGGVLTEGTSSLPIIIDTEDDDITEYDTPAWSLGRLLEMLPSPIPISEDLPTFHHYAYLNLSNDSVGYYWENYDGVGRALVGFSGKGFSSAVVDATEWLIKEGNFPKEYLEE